MDINNPKYDNFGLHVVLALFTVENEKFKVLLIKRKNEPFKNKWILIGGAAYNDEEAIDAMNREIFEKTRIENISFELFNVFTKPNRSPLKRMIALGYLGVSDSGIIEKFKQTEKSSDAEWFEIDNIPELGYDHKEILDEAIETLKHKIFKTSIIKKLFPETFTLPALQTTYESILGIKLDRRNFRKKLITENIIEETNETLKTDKSKPSKLYKFTNITKSFSFYKWRF